MVVGFVKREKKETREGDVRNENNCEFFHNYEFYRSS